MYFKGGIKLKLMNADKIIESVSGMLSDVVKHPAIANATDDTGNKIEYNLKTSVNRKKESDGSFNIVLELRRKGVKDWKCIVIYFAEHSHGITTLVVNGILHNIIFENSTMDSPNALLSYLPEIILSDVKYLKECKPQPPRQRRPKPYKGGGDRKKPHKDIFADKRRPRQPRTYHPESTSGYYAKYHGNSSSSSYKKY